MNGRGPATPALALAALLVAGCGGGSDSPRRTAQGREAPAHRPAPAAKHLGDVGVIRTWADTLRAGNPDGAARFFGVPVTVANGTQPLTLHSPVAVRAFNESLPCGARLLRARRKGRYIVATFRLTERPGGDCGSGVGDTAATAFRLRRGKIVEWLRVPSDLAPLPPPDTSSA